VNTLKDDQLLSFEPDSFPRFAPPFLEVLFAFCPRLLVDLRCVLLRFEPPRPIRRIEINVVIVAVGIARQKISR